MYYKNNAGGWNKTHGQAEKFSRIDSLELPMGKPWATMYCGCDELGYQSVEVDAEADTAHLYMLGWRKSATVKLSHKRNGYGGEQIFFLCPECGQRVRYLYLMGCRFLCRKCAGLNYRSQQKTEDSMTDYYRGMAYAEKFLKLPPWQIDGFSFVDLLPDRPRYMRKTTYRKHMKRFLKYRERYAQKLIAEMMALTAHFK